MKPFRSTKLRNSARGKDCAVNFPGCRNERETVVLAHSNYNEDGKGMGQKAHDWAACHCCAHCHNILDNGHRDFTKEEIRDQFHRAMKQTWVIWIKDGLITIK